jgi:hypothetical protein
LELGADRRDFLDDRAECIGLLVAIPAPRLELLAVEAEELVDRLECRLGLGPAAAWPDLDLLDGLVSEPRE